MNNIKIISKKRKFRNRNKAILDEMIKQNPKLSELINKLDLRISKTQNYEHK